MLKSNPVLCAIPVVISTNSLSCTQEQNCLVKEGALCLGKKVTFEEVASFDNQVCKVVLGKHAFVQAIH